MASFHLFFNPFAEVADFSGVFKYFQLSLHVFLIFFSCFSFLALSSAVFSAAERRLGRLVKLLKEASSLGTAVPVVAL